MHFLQGEKLQIIFYLSCVLMFGRIQVYIDCQVFSLCLRHAQTTHTLTGGQACWHSLSHPLWHFLRHSPTALQAQPIFKLQGMVDIIKLAHFIWRFGISGKNSLNVSGGLPSLPSIHLSKQHWLWLIVGYHEKQQMLPPPSVQGHIKSVYSSFVPTGVTGCEVSYLIKCLNLCLSVWLL